MFVPEDLVGQAEFDVEAFAKVAECGFWHRLSQASDDRFGDSIETEIESRATKTHTRQVAGTDSMTPDESSEEEILFDITPKTEEGGTAVRIGLRFAATVIRVYNGFMRLTGVRNGVPKSFISLLSFFPPPPWKYYYLSYFDAEADKRVFGDACAAYDKPDPRVEPVIDFRDPYRVALVRDFAARSDAFVVKSGSGNYLVCVKIRASSPNPSKKAIVVANSNGCDVGLTLLGHVGLFVSPSHPADHDVYLFDYSGYGLSTGKPSEEVVYQDIASVYDYILEERDDPETQMVIFGVSIGTAVVADLAAKHPANLAGVVLVSPLTSGMRHVSAIDPPLRTSAADCFNTLDKAPFIDVPLLCVHGLSDSMMPAQNSAQIYSAAPNGVRPLFVPGGSHLGVMDSPDLDQRLHDFLDKEILEF